MTAVLTASAVAPRLTQAFPDVVLEEGKDWVRVPSEQIANVCRFLRDTNGLDFDYPEAISAVDYIDRFQLVYHLVSLRRNHMFVVKADVYGREDPTAPSVTDIWLGANLQEREIYDLMGITFEGHPNMKRVLLWDGFPGHPLRKDFRADVVPEPREAGL